MQYRMKTHQLTEEQIRRLLTDLPVASLATVCPDGAPYVTPVHFFYADGRVYVHGLPAGKKLDNLKAEPRVSLAVYQMDALLLDPEGKPCDTNTKYESVILQGTASLVADLEKKEAILREIVKKYTPHLSIAPLPANMVKSTAVIEIVIQEQTGKYYQ